jgi:hypothetical protein
MQGDSGGSMLSICQGAEACELPRVTTTEKRRRACSSQLGSRGRTRGVCTPLPAIHNVTGAPIFDEGIGREEDLASNTSAPLNVYVLHLGLSQQHFCPILHFCPIVRAPLESASVRLAVDG